jgi:hypothetical protein
VEVKWVKYSNGGRKLKMKWIISFGSKLNLEVSCGGGGGSEGAAFLTGGFLAGVEGAFSAT